MSDHRQTDLITLTRHMLHEQRNHPHATGQLTLLLASIQLGCKFVATSVRKAGIVNLTGLAGSSNVQGEAQKTLDILSNEIFINSLRSAGSVGIMVSEENDEPIIIRPPHAVNPRYAVVFDPLDGSSNIEAGISIGTIFGIYRLQQESPGNIADVLVSGKNMVCAGYCIYGSSTLLVISYGSSVNGYTLDTSIGEFILTDPNIQIPKRGSIYSVNEGNTSKWSPQCRKYFENLKFPASGSERKPYSLRYIGSMVADVHRTIKYGGIFCYPADSSSKAGKLRLLYECFPMAFIVEKAGGKASTGSERILDIVPTSIHQRSPIFLGSEEDVNELELMLKSGN